MWTALPWLFRIPNFRLNHTVFASSISSTLLPRQDAGSTFSNAAAGKEEGLFPHPPEVARVRQRGHLSRAFTTTWQGWGHGSHSHKLSAAQVRKRISLPECYRRGGSTPFLVSSVESRGVSVK